ncbi:DUF4625 domain-containing protein [uncultured Proteiniphilum sp.]|uniref:DUF4625 domain-containing protein n=1 Tax=uncultured Proteiniphilum sp. TaxID=497637 RepID=UPI0026062D1B|nr:DUF4625 domain-containing protein [uncultured Proteiniphilum sp.]
MKRKLFWGAMLFLSASVLFLSSCDKDDKPLAPTVKITELGSGHDNPNDKIAYAGSEAHIEAEITADGLIREIAVEVHQEDGDYTFNKVYTDAQYVGVKNTTFHEHLAIPSEAPEGEYHLHLSVIDQQGQTGEAESHLTIMESDEDDHDDDH